MTNIIIKMQIVRYYLQIIADTWYLS